MLDKVIKNCNPYLKYGYRRGAELLEDSLATKVYIRSDTFMKMLMSGNFFPYCFDGRCNQVLWLSKDTCTWLFIEISLPKLYEVNV